MNRYHRWYCGSARWRKALEKGVLPWALDGVDLGDDALEIGPGPGLTTDVLRTKIDKLTCLEIDPKLYYPAGVYRKPVQTWPGVTLNPREMLKAKGIEVDE